MTPHLTSLLVSALKWKEMKFSSIIAPVTLPWKLRQRWSVRELISQLPPRLLRYGKTGARTLRYNQISFTDWFKQLKIKFVILCTFKGGKKKKRRNNLGWAAAIYNIKSFPTLSSSCNAVQLYSWLTMVNRVLWDINELYLISGHCVPFFFFFLNSLFWCINANSVLKVLFSVTWSEILSTRHRVPTFL